VCVCVCVCVYDLSHTTHTQAGTTPELTPRTTTPSPSTVSSASTNAPAAVASASGASTKTLVDTAPKRSEFEDALADCEARSAPYLVVLRDDVT
jgi:hypothetical protein